MRILLCATDIYSVIGGGQVFYRELIRANPHHEFAYPSTGSVDHSGAPPNVRAFQIPNHYRAQESSIDAAYFSGFEIGGRALGGKQYDFLYLLDLASSVAGRRFDVVDIPDFIPFAAFIPYALRHLGVGFDKLVVSMHGTLTMGLLENWSNAAVTPNDIEVLECAERLFYESGDVRYGIGKQYISDWREKTGISARLLDVSRLIDIDSFEKLRAEAEEAADIAPLGKSRKPDAVFVGRQEKWKGPDLFVEVAANLPRKTYAEAKFIGPAISLGGVNSWAELSAMAKRRGLAISCAEHPRQELLATFARGKMLAIFPSRKDTFNLTALEAVLCGVPAAISSRAGVCDFLDAAFPGLPYVKLDPEDASKSSNLVEKALAEFEGLRTRLIDFLAEAKPLSVGSDLTEIYNDPESSFDVAARKCLESAFAPMLAYISEVTVNAVRSKVKAHIGHRLDDMFGSGQKKLQQHLQLGYDEYFALSKIIGEARKESDRLGFLSDDAMENLSRKLLPFVFSTNRVYIYQQLAELERRRGNDLLYATYQIRCLRLSGRNDPAILSEICGILERFGFHEEAQAARMMYGQSFDFDGALTYLSAMPTRFPTPPQGQIETVLDRRTLDRPKVSVVISLYRAADKIPNFLRGIKSFTESSRSAMELVLIDSFSPDDTYEVVKRELDAMVASERSVSAYYLRTSVRETIQKAWNRGIDAARGEYLAFLGADEMNRPDAFDIMARYLDRNPGVDWVQGTALVTEVNKAGSFVRDLMQYDRRFDNDFMQLFDTCYLGYVGALYRRSIHDRVGFYDDRFKAAGDTEFKNRALPFMRAVTLPEGLGYFLNYPEARTTQSPTAEIEDIRAWYLHRTPAGIAYQYGATDGAELKELFSKCLSYRKSYLDFVCTDVELAVSVATYLKMRHPASFRDLFAKLPAVESVRDMYRVVDDLHDLFGGANNLMTVHELGGTIEKAGYAMALALRSFAHDSVQPNLGFSNDNRSHQHHYIWGSQSQKILVERPAGLSDLAGPKDLAEVLSSCESTDERVDFESAWRTNQLSQVKRLFQERSLGVAIEAGHLSDVDSTLKAFLQRKRDHSLLLMGRQPEDVRSPPALLEERRVYFTGPVANVRPALAAARVVGAPNEPERVGSCLAALVKAVTLGKPVVADASLVEAAEKMFEGLSFSAVATAMNMGELLDLAEAIASDDERRLKMASASLRLAQELARHPRSAVPLGADKAGLGHEDAEFIEWNERIAYLNRLTRDTLEQSGVASALALLKIESEREMRAISDALLVVKNAPILSTRQRIAP